MLGAATTLFLRATLGFEKDIMAQAVLHFLSHSLIHYALILFLLQFSLITFDSSTGLTISRGGSVGQRAPEACCEGFLDGP